MLSWLYAIKQNRNSHPTLSTLSTSTLPETCDANLVRGVVASSPAQTITNTKSGHLDYGNALGKEYTFLVDVFQYVYNNKQGGRYRRPNIAEFAEKTYAIS
jgi:hypothetical protein